MPASRISAALKESATKNCFVALKKPIAYATAKKFEAVEFCDMASRVAGFWDSLIPLKKITRAEKYVDGSGKKAVRTVEETVPAYTVDCELSDELMKHVESFHTTLHYDYTVAEYLSLFRGHENERKFDALNAWKWSQQFQVTNFHDFRLAFKLFMINVKRSMAGEPIEYPGLFGMWEPSGGSGKSYDLECLQSACSDGNTSATRWTAFDSSKTAGGLLLESFGIVRVDELDVPSLAHMKDLIKEMISSGEVTVNKKYENPVTIKKRFQVCCSANKPISRYAFEDESGNQRRDMTFRVIGAKIWAVREELTEFYRRMLELCPIVYTDDVKAWYMDRREGDNFNDEHISVIQRLLKLDTLGVGACAAGAALSIGTAHYEASDILNWYKDGHNGRSCWALSKKGLSRKAITDQWRAAFGDQDKGDIYSLGFLLDGSGLFEVRSYDKLTTYKFNTEKAVEALEVNAAQEKQAAPLSKRPRLEESSKMTCDEMVAAAYEAAGIEEDEGDGENFDDECNGFEGEAE